MLHAVIARDFMELRRDRRLVVGAALIAAFALIALLLGTLAQSSAAEDRAAAVAADRAIWEGQGEVNPHSAAHFGQYAFKPPPALGLFDRGYTPFLGQAVWIEAHYQNPAQARPAEASTTLQRFGDLSPAWILQTLLPLFVILAGFSSLAGERERGTLRLQLVQGAQARRLILAKTASLFLVSSLMLAPLMALGLIGAASAGPLSGDAILRWLVLVGAYFAYLAIWCGLTISVSGLAASARQALVILLALWALAAVLAPRLAAENAVAAHPIPAAGAFWEQIADARAQGIDGHNPSDARTRSLEQETLRRYGVSRLEDLPIDFAGISLQAGEDYGNLVFDRLYGGIAAAERAQSARQLWYAPLSPLVALRPISMGASGSDLAHQQHFLGQAEGHRRHVQRLLNQEQARTGKGQNFNNRVAADFWRGIPTFAYAPPDFASVARAYAGAAGIVAGWLLAAFVLLLLAARRLEARA